MIFAGAAEDWEADRRVAAQSEDDPRVVMDHLVVPGIDNQPRHEEGFWLALAALIGLVIAVIGAGAVLYGFS